MNINLSFREEITICILIYFIAMMTIPIILTSNSNQTLKTARKLESVEDRSFRNELLMNSISIFEINNRKKNSSKIDLSNIIYSPTKHLRDLLEVEIKELMRRNKPRSTTRKLVKKTWKTFNFINNSTLKSNSLQIPLKVDW